MGALRVVVTIVRRPRVSQEVGTLALLAHHLNEHLPRIPVMDGSLAQVDALDGGRQLIESGLVVPIADGAAGCIDGTRDPTEEATDSLGVHRIDMEHRGGDGAELVPIHIVTATYAVDGGLRGLEVGRAGLPFVGSHAIGDDEDNRPEIPLHVDRTLAHLGLDGFGRKRNSLLG